MFTDCPGCQRQFRLTARHLSAAAGEVRCGFCGLRFNALERLRDAPVESALPLPAEPDPGEELVMEGPAPDEPDLQEPEFDIAMAEPLPAAAVAMTWTPRGSLRTAPDALDVPDGDAAAPPRRRLLWTVIALLLAGAAGLQVLWFERDAVLARYPQLRPRAEQLCAQLGCTVLRRRDLAAIVVVNRDVRDHPRYEDTLLVNATISNGAAFAQPFPRIELAFSDTNGRVIAARTFAAREYLDASMVTQRGMEPDTPVHVVLEIAGVDAGAASFEIGFR
jgi:predicted Zn finger-like uncharacterized protein